MYDWKQLLATLFSSILVTGAAHAADARQPADVLIRGGTPAQPPSRKSSTSS